MATTYTTNYHLGMQTDTSDKFDMSVITDNMPIIDEQMKQNETSAALNTSALVGLVDGGAKNLFKNTGTSKANNSVTFTISDDGTVEATGTASPSNSVLEIGTATVAAGKYIVSGCPEGGSWAPNPNKYRIRVAVNGTWVGDDKGSGLEIDVNDGDTVSLQCNTAVGYEAALVFKPMICTKAAWGISQAYQPYRPSYQELYDMVLALQSGGTRSLNVIEQSEEEVK